MADDEYPDFRTHTWWPGHGYRPNVTIVIPPLVPGLMPEVAEDAECRTCWNSHGCDVKGPHDDTEHVCGPCPEDCTGDVDPGWLYGWLAAEHGSCVDHCDSRPQHGREHGMVLFDVPPRGSGVYEDQRRRSLVVRAEREASQNVFNLLKDRIHGRG